MGRICRFQGGPRVGAWKGEPDIGLLTQVMVQRPSRLGGWSRYEPPSSPPPSQAQRGRGGLWGEQSSCAGRVEPLHQGQESVLKPELPGGEAGRDPGVLGAIPPHPTPLSRVGDVTSVRSNSQLSAALLPLHRGGYSLPGGEEGVLTPTVGAGPASGTGLPPPCLLPSLPRTWAQPRRLQPDSPQAAVVSDAGGGRRGRQQRT